MSEEQHQEASDLITQRRSKLERLREKGIDPYPLRAECTHAVAEALQTLEDWAARGEEGGPPDIEKVKPILFAPESHTYHGVGKHLGQAFAIGKELSS